MLNSFIVTPGRAANRNPPLDTIFDINFFITPTFEKTPAVRGSAVSALWWFHFPYSILHIPREGRTSIFFLGGHQAHQDLCKHQWLCFLPEPLSAFPHTWDGPTGTSAIKPLIKNILVPRDVPKDLLEVTFQNHSWSPGMCPRISWSWPLLVKSDSRSLTFLWVQKITTPWGGS